MNKKGSFSAIVFIFIGVMLVLLMVYAGTILSAVMNNAMGELQPLVAGLGDTDTANFTEINSVTFVPLQNMTQQFNWLLGVFYVVGLLSIFILAVAFRTSGNQWLIPVFILFGVLLFIFTIFISNSYEEFYNDNGVIGQEFQEQTFVSYLMIYSPIVCLITFFIAGIIMFTGNREEGFA